MNGHVAARSGDADVEARIAHYERLSAAGQVPA